ncbi:sensor domain-containing phosphodiesterase [Aliidiomarina sp. Khilg15.8]
MPAEVAAESTEAELLRQQKVIDRLKMLTHKYRQAEVVQKALFRISELASSVHDMNQLYASVHSIIGELMAANNFYICLYDGQQEVVDFPYFVDEYDTKDTVTRMPAKKLKRGITGYVLRTGEPLLLTKDNFYELENSGEIDKMGSLHVDWLGVPLLSSDQVIGAMVVQSYQEEVRYSDSDLELLMFVSQHVVNALERFRQRELMEAEIKRQTAELRVTNEDLLKEITVREKAELQTSVLFAISELTNSSEDMHSFYAELHKQISKLLNAENFYVALLTENGQQVYFPYYVDENDRRVKQRRLRKGMTEYVLRHGSPTMISHKERAELVRRGEIVVGNDSGALAKQWLGSPLTIDDDVFGVLAVQSYDGEQTYSREDLELLNFVSQHVAVAIERRRSAEKLARANIFLEKRIAERTEELVDEIERRKKIEERLYYDAHHDNLTGLPNRAMFTDRVQQAIDEKKRNLKQTFSVLFIDLDRFKNINDTLGHSAGDQFLLEVSQRLRSAVDSKDLIARIGGDEFVILLENNASAEFACEVAEHIINTMKEPFILDDQEHFSGASIGIASSRDINESVDRLLRDADAAMYEAKSTGRGRYVVFDDTIRHGLVEAITQESALRSAQVHEDFVLWYQPIYGLDSNKIEGYEVLLRWQKGNDLLAPEQFMVMAERSGAILEIDHWVLRQCCEFLVAEQGPALDCPMHINLSAQHLLNLRYLKTLEDVIESYDIDRQSVVLEFNEQSLLQHDGKRILASLRRLSDFGVKLALDDFGRASGPLHFIYNYPFDIIKLDRNFVRQTATKARARAMVRHVVTLCEELSIKLTAEGLESKALLKQLRKLGVHHGQGNLFCAAQKLTNLKDGKHNCA